ncbi:hypothetical protein ACJ72_04600 [Emergomyces africanus]|uniref:Rhodopsin domain-containing protein n=1 Tax=Emergomyces africanus TaxID=1955775 RepID=A0A1B7NWB3_9EURO|nr:hypothetical protein ACJ72_04600 [Emergomyces africanus]
MEKSQCIRAVAASFAALSWAIVALRCYVRLTLTHWGIDDLFVVLSLLIFSGFATVLIYASTQGLGKHNEDIKSRDAVVNAFKAFFLCDLFYIASSGIVKISFCLSLLRVIVIGRAHVYAIYTVGAITALFTIFYWFFTLFTCWPVDFLWNQIRNPDGHGSCRHFRNVVAGSYAHSAIVCAGDLTLAIVPALMLRKLNLNYRTKLSAGVLLGFGSVASIATIARLVYVRHGYDQIDFLYTNSEIMIWSVTEIGVSIIAVSAVTLKPLMVKYKIFFHSTNNSPSPYPRGHIHGSGNDSFACAVGPGPRKAHHNRFHKRSPPGFGSSILRTDNTIMGNGQSSSEENIWTSKGDGEQSTNTSEGIPEDFELVPRGKIQKVVEFSTSRATNEPDDDETVPTTEREYMEGP